MKSVFICDNPQDIKRVYREKVLTALGLTDTVFSGEEVRAQKENFTDTQFIFSTWGMPVFTGEEIKEIFPSLQCVFYAAGTVQYFARPFLQNGVRIFSAWAANAVPVAEFTMAQILLAGKGFFAASRVQSVGETEKATKLTGQIRGNYGAKVGIIGAGMIGKKAIELLKAFNLEILVFDPFLPDETAKTLGVKKAELSQIFSECSVISNHLANNEQTKGILNYKYFKCMPPYATFINTGRGAQVAEDDLAKILTERPDVTALLDVTDPEPPEANHPFYKLSNCILTPHIAGSMGDEVCRMAEYMLDEYTRFTAGEPCHCEVSEAMLETMA